MGDPDIQQAANEIPQAMGWDIDGSEERPGLEQAGTKEGDSSLVATGDPGSDHSTADWPPLHKGIASHLTAEGGEWLVRPNVVASADGRIWLEVRGASLTVFFANRFTGGLVEQFTFEPQPIREPIALSVSRLGTRGGRAVVRDEASGSVYLLRWSDFNDATSFSVNDLHSDATTALLLKVSCFLLESIGVCSLSPDRSLAVRRSKTRGSGSVLDVDAVEWGDRLLLIQLRDHGQHAVAELNVIPATSVLDAWPVEGWHTPECLGTDPCALGLVRHPPGRRSPEDPIVAVVDAGHVSGSWDAATLGLRDDG